MWKSRVLHTLPARLTLIGACAVLLAAAVIAARPQIARADRAAPPPVPANLNVPAGNSAFLIGHATGTQNYICLGTQTGIAWAFIGPQATVFGDNGEQLTTHFLSPNPAEGGTARATWQHSQDTSSVWAAAIASSTDPAYVAPGAIPWLLLERKGSQNGPTGGDTLTGTTYIQRVNTTGGVTPASGCRSKTDLGKRAFVPYTADYVFYQADLP